MLRCLRHAYGDESLLVIGLFTAENRGLLDKVLAGPPRQIRVGSRSPSWQIPTTGGDGFDRPARCRAEYPIRRR